MRSARSTGYVPGYGSSTHGTTHALLHRRLHGPRGTESQDRLRHAGGHAGRRGRRPRCLLGPSRTRGGAQASSRHHAYVHRRPSGCRRRSSGMVWLLHRWNEKRRRRKLEAAQPHPRRTGSASPAAAGGALGLALSHLLHRRAFATSRSTGPTTTASARSSRSIRAGTRAASCSLPSRCCGRFFY